jgi:hypothetical protein
MSLTVLGVLISLLALAVSIWTRLEAFTSLRRQRKIELVRRLGDALSQALETKAIYLEAHLLRVVLPEPNSDNLGDPLTCDELSMRLEEISDLADQAEELLKFATGGRVNELDPVIMEAQIALLTKHKHDATSAARQLRGMAKHWSAP